MFSTDDPSFWKMTFATHMILIRSRYFIMLSKSNLKYTAKVFLKMCIPFDSADGDMIFFGIENLVFVLFVISRVEYIFMCWLFVFLL